MPSRREFLGFVAGALALPSRLIAEEGNDKHDVNERLEEMAKAYRGYKEIASADPLLVPGAKKGLVHWEWAHFTPYLTPEELRAAEACQREYFSVMAEAMQDERIGLEEIMNEGIIEGMEKRHVGDQIRVLRDGVRNKLSVHSPFTLSSLRPSEDAVSNGMEDFATLSAPVPQNVWFYDHRSGRMRSKTLVVSPMGRVGAGIALASAKGLKIAACEDRHIDAQAERAELHGTEEQVKKWVHTERNWHFVQLVAKGRRSIAHLLCGYNHDLRKDAEKQGVSLLIVTPKSVAADRERVKAE